MSDTNEFGASGTETAVDTAQAMELATTGENPTNVTLEDTEPEASTIDAPDTDLDKLAASHNRLKKDIYDVRQQKKELQTTADTLREEVATGQARILELETEIINIQTDSLISHWSLNDADADLVRNQPTIEARTELTKRLAPNIFAAPFAPGGVPPVHGKPDLMQDSGIPKLRQRGKARWNPF